ncbi:MAG TPA: NAD(P)H-hydrate dehydratase [Sphingomicrobium sp.]
MRRHPLPPIEEGDKDSHGKLLLIAGSNQTPGSAVIAATAALRSGCGKVRIMTVEPMAAPIATAVPEAMVMGSAMGRDGGISRAAVRQIEARMDEYEYDAVVAGPGMKQGKACEMLAGKLLDASIERLELDAAMLYALPPHTAAARSAPSPVLLPHDREMAALIGCEEGDVARDPLRCGLECAERYGALVLVKGAQSHVVTPDGSAWRYEGGGPGLGVSGSGDALAGIIGGLLARGAEPLTALLWGVWLHGEAGASLARKVGTIGFLAREISAEIPGLLDRAQPLE